MALRTQLGVRLGSDPRLTPVFVFPRAIPPGVIQPSVHAARHDVEHARAAGACRHGAHERDDVVIIGRG